ncbi:MAG: LUD domain-containing protein [Clostridia bacterium]|nr:LUD domain-containing protein [Clostridia bacterium]
MPVTNWFAGSIFYNIRKYKFHTICKKQLACDVFITSTNAVTIGDRLINTNASGNRIAAMISGPGFSQYYNSNNR